eukprot:3247111-Rhodomonas_salina.1
MAPPAKLGLKIQRVWAAVLLLSVTPELKLRSGTATKGSPVDINAPPWEEQEREMSEARGAQDK